MSVQPYFKAAPRLQVSVPHATQYSGQYTSRTTAHETGQNIVRNLMETLKELHPHDRRRLLSITNMELTDTQFRRMLRLALQS